MDISYNPNLPTPDTESDTLHHFQNLEQCLKTSQARLDCLLETLPQIVWLAQANGSVIHFNSRWYEYTGLTAVESLDWEFHKAIHPDDRDRFYQRFATSLAPTDEVVSDTQTSNKIECRIRGSDGTYRWFIGQKTPVRGSQGEVLEWVGTYTPSKSIAQYAQSLWQTSRGVPWVKPSSLQHLDEPLEFLGELMYEQGERESSFSLFPSPSQTPENPSVHSVSPSGVNGQKTQMRQHWEKKHSLRPVELLTKLAVSNQQPAQGVWRGQGTSSNTENQAAQQHLCQLISKLSHAIVWEAEATTDQFTFVSQSAEQVLGYPVEQWLNEPNFWTNLIHPEDRQWTLALCHKQRVQGRDYELVYRCRRADNQVIWLRDRAFVVQDEQGRIHKRRGLMVDITPIKQAEIEFHSRIHSSSAIAKLTQQAISAIPISTLMDKAVSLVSQTLQLEYCQVLELLPDGNALKLTAGVGWREELGENALIEANVNTQAGYTLQTRQPVVVEDLSSESRFQGSPLLHDHGIMSGMSVIIPGVPSVRVGETGEHPSAEGGGVTNISQPLPPSSPPSPPSSSSPPSPPSSPASPAPNKTRPFGVLAAYTSRQRVLTRSEVDFLQSVANVLGAAIQYQQANAVVGKVQAQLAQTTVALEKCTREFDQFAYIASHDLKAPLRAIANLSEWIEEDLSYQLHDENLHQLQLLRGRVRRLEVLIEGLLQYSRAGRLKSELERIDVAALLTHVIDTLNPPSEFTCEISPGMPVLLTERLPLQQVFTHLIDNAIKHHPSTAGTVKISVQEQPEAYEFAVTDDGAGIAPQFHERVFGIFQTLQVKDKVENAGVGLAIAKKIVEGKGGTIRLESQDDGGATFYFTWPKQLSQV